MVYTALAILAAVLPAALANSGQELVRRNATNGPLPGWSLVGCFTDSNPASRTLLQKTTVNPSMTPALCTGFCAGQNFAGVEFTDECFCDFNIGGTAKEVNSTLCNLPCGGDSTFECGGASLITIYQNTTGVLPKNKATVAGNWSFSACHTDAVNGTGRTLLERLPILTVTIETCTTACSSAGFNISGLEFGQECWCGSSFLVANTTAATTDCSQACDADHTELCGAASRLSVYLKS